MAQHTIAVVNGGSNGALCRMKTDLLVHYGLAWRKYWTMARPVSTGSGSMSARLPLVPTICRVPWRQSKFSNLRRATSPTRKRSEEHTSELQSRFDLVCRLLLEKKKTH